MAMGLERPGRKDNAGLSGPADHPVALALWTLIGLCLAIGLIILTYDALLLLFAGVLFAVLLRAMTRGVVRLTGLPDSLGLAVTALCLLVLGAAAVLLAAPSVTEQVANLVQAVPQAWNSLTDRISRGMDLAGPLGEVSKDMGSELTPDAGTLQTVLGSGFGAITGAIGAVGSLFVVLVTGLYLAADPDVYRRGIVRLIPIRGRGRAREILELIGHRLEGWLVGAMIDMALVGSLTWLGLWFLDIPMALTLALFAALMTFVPNIGPVLGFVPILLVALGQGTGTLLAAFALYIAVQTVESYLVTPLVQQRAIALPPVLIFFAQIILGLVFGLWGLALAMPLTAAISVLIEELYIKDGLEGGSLQPARST
ncbi:AI-2E family transporter [Geminicoccus flavidas]|uniref:AI-2E family transporter n=1 Tax=Geminicoccus flavidas TaxID=2506407 RepID=UPI00135C2AB8|nr:AI-2E family transporter [Geminicoccus flavidas]